MTLNIFVPTSTQELRPKITVVGVGGAGGNAVNNMITADLEGVDFLVANTDGQALAGSLAPRKIQLGRTQTQGLGAGSKPEIGRIAAEESLDDILAELADSHMVFITAGMGGGTGTGAAPIIAKAARERGILTVGVVTKPFDFEGQKRMTQASNGIEELQAYVDTLIIIPNQNLFRLANERTTFADAFAMADEVLHKGVCGVTDLMIKPGNINLDFADIRTVMSEMGKAMMGTGEASGENRATNAAEAAINNPLLDETNMKGAQAVLINITGGKDMTLFEVDEAANHIRREVDGDATIIFGSALDDKMEGIMRVSVVATGMEALPMAMRPTTSETMIHHHQPAASVEVAEDASVTASFDEASMDASPMMDAEIPASDHAETMDNMMGMSDVPFELTNQLDAEEELQEETLTAAEDEGDAHSDEETLEMPFNLDEAASVDEAASEPSADMIAELADEADSMMEENTDTAEEEAPFKLRQTVEIPEETAETNVQEGPKSLIGHLSRMMFASKPAAQPQEEPVVEKVEAPSISPAETVNVISADMPSLAVKDDAPSEETVEADEPSAASSGIAALKPTTQPQLDIAKAGEDVDLDIPAFLRRQAN